MITAKVILDSISPLGCRLTTFELVFPRFILAEFNTHRMFSRNAASSRAIPTSKIIKQVEEDPALPVWWGKNQAGMQAQEELVGEERAAAIIEWLEARDNAIKHAKALNKLGVHKQIVNRVLEPWMWVTDIMSTTEIENFFTLRCHPAAQPEFKQLAYCILEAYSKSNPKPLRQNEWHLPYIYQEERDMGFSIPDLLKISVSRCAAVSYMRQNDRKQLEKHFELHDRLLENRHMSPFEHQAMAMSNNAWYGNFEGWLQYRKTIPNESGRKK